MDFNSWVSKQEFFIYHYLYPKKLHWTISCYVSKFKLVLMAVCTESLSIVLDFSKYVSSERHVLLIYYSFWNSSQSTNNNKISIFFQIAAETFVMNPVKRYSNLIESYIFSLKIIFIILDLSESVITSSDLSFFMKLAKIDWTIIKLLICTQ